MKKENRLSHWYSYFDIGIHTVTISGSYLTGSESVYIDDNLVSKKTNWTFKSKHRVVIDEQSIDIVIELLELFKPQIRVQLYREDNLIDEDYLCEGKRNSANLTLSLLVSVSVAFISGVIFYFLGKSIGSLIGSFFTGG